MHHGYLDCRPGRASSSKQAAPEKKRNYLLPDRERDHDPDESTALQALDRLGDLASCWWSIFEMIRECDAHGAKIKGFLPEWARDRIGDWRQQHEAHDAMRLALDDARRAVAIAEGRQKAVFEIWSKRGHRLDGRYEYRTQADAALNSVKERYPDAFVARVHYHAPAYSGHGVELLDTLIGRIYWCGQSFGRGSDEEDEHYVQDETGRTVGAPRSVLAKHPCFQRMSKDGQRRVVWVDDRQQKEAA